MKPGEILVSSKGDINLNAGLESMNMLVAN
jgi:urease beta subunit